LRDGLVLRLNCECRHIAEPDLKELRAANWRRIGGEELADRALEVSERGSWNPDRWGIPIDREKPA
jgi:hypothetical protein